MKSRHFESQVIPGGQWRRLDRSQVNEDRTHAIPTDDVGRRFVEALVAGHFQPGARPGWALVEGREIPAIRLFTVEPEDDELMFVLMFYDEQAEAYARTQASGDTTVS